MYIIRKLIICIFILVLSSCGNSKKDNDLVVGISPDYPPFEMVKNGEVIGFDVDLVNEISKELGKNLVIKEMEFSSLIPSLNTNKIDIAISGLTNNSTRSKNVSFSAPYFQVSLAAVFKESSPVNSSADLSGKKIGVQTGSTLEEFAKNIPDAQLTSLDNNLQIVQELMLGRIDVMLCENSQAPEFVKNSDLNFATFGNLEAEYAIALKKNNPLKTDIDKAIQSLIDNGSLDKINNKWITKS